MQLNNQQESGQAASSVDGQIALALGKMKKEIEVTMIRTVQHVVGPFMEDLIRKVIKEEIQSAQQKFPTGGNRNHVQDIIASRERNLQLKFLDEVSAPVLTGKATQGKGGTPIRVALFDKSTGRVVDCGPESSAKVEILVLDSSNDNDECDLSLEDFNTRIIREGDKKKPHFSKSNYVYLKEGIGLLYNSRLGHDSSWMKSCKCRLGAKIVENLGGIKVQEAWTESFMVLDSRSRLYENHYPPSLSDDIWRLENIGKDGPPCKRLNENGIFTVKDFLLLHSIDPLRLQQIVFGANWKPTVASSAKWKAPVDHARSCIIDDNRIFLYYYPSSEFHVGIAFDVVGGLKGVIHASRFYPINNLSEAEKACAQKILLSAFENQKDITSFIDENALMDQFPYNSSDANAARNSNQVGHYGSDFTNSGSNNGHDPMEPGSSSQSITQTMCHSSSLGSITMGQSYSPRLEDPYQGPSCSFSDSDPLSEGNFGDFKNLMSLIFPESNNVSETFMAEPHSHQQSNAGGNWSVEAVKDIHVQKKNRAR